MITSRNRSAQRKKLEMFQRVKLSNIIVLRWLIFFKNKFKSHKAQIVLVSGFSGFSCLNEFMRLLYMQAFIYSSLVGLGPDLKRIQGGDGTENPPKWGLHRHQHAIHIYKKLALLFPNNNIDCHGSQHRWTTLSEILNPGLSQIIKFKGFHYSQFST